ncbi:type III secretion system outer membrane ring subunit SctC [Pseudomonas sp. MAFF 301449]|uniref:Type III secretion system outer membrane ring subunit SctC n=1 Tax=Pseudomonas cyclaminis TaxID=2781239 RepID=A0ABR9SUF3_9PSED|nr:type III secretion system outer membrane ring subunit SctC [Pseudomonas cyclaminis]MBE8592562.1 type III secretion system outer membrane ring subunit SctC [Pseudomonas cyclaminis]MBE8601330.1 type III secretion system outer membrane ring subunit SctC [Pseudomonas cyclaminis]
MPRFWFLLAALMLGSNGAWGETYQAQDESLHTVFTVLSAPLGLPIVVSRDVARTRISELIDLDTPQHALETLALQYGLIWYSDGQVLYLYDASEEKSSAVALRHISVDRFRSLMRRAGIDETRYPLRVRGARTFYVSGPPNYVDHVLHLAQLMDRERADLSVGTQAFAVVQVLNTHVADREYGMGNEKIIVPGIASTIETVLAAEQKGPLADKSLAVIAYPDTNSLLIKGKPAQLSVIERLVAELDTPKRSVEVSLWMVDVDGDELKKLDPAWDKDAKTQATRIMAPLDDNRLMAQIATLERQRRARVTTLPVILTQENVPAVFQDNHTFYLPRPGDDSADWRPVRYGAQVSVLPRFAEANQIEMLLHVEDSRQLSEAGQGGKPAAVGRVGISSVVRVPQGKRLWLGAFSREVREPGRSAVASGSAKVRLFVIQARAVDSELKSPGSGLGPPPLTAAQYERVQRAFVRPGRDISP